MHKHDTFLRENISKIFLWLNVRDQKYILKTEHGEENKMYLFLFKTMILYLGWASWSSMNPHNNKNLIQTWDSLIHEYAIHHHIVLCYNIKNSNTAQCNISCYALRPMGTKIMHMTMIIREFLCSYHLINYVPLNIRSIVGAKACYVENISVSILYTIY